MAVLLNLFLPEFKKKIKKKNWRIVWGTFGPSPPRSFPRALLGRFSHSSQGIPKSLQFLFQVRSNAAASCPDPTVFWGKNQGKGAKSCPEPPPSIPSKPWPEFQAGKTPETPTLFLPSSHISAPAIPKPTPFFPFFSHISGRFPAGFLGISAPQHRNQGLTGKNPPPWTAHPSFPKHIPKATKSYKIPQRRSSFPHSPLQPLFPFSLTKFLEKTTKKKAGICISQAPRFPNTGRTKRENNNPKKQQKNPQFHEVFPKKKPH